MATYTSQYPTLDTDHVKATSYYTTDYYPHIAFDHSKSLIGGDTGNSWLSNLSSTNQRVHADLGTGYAIRRLYYENYHATGGNTNRGIKTFSFWGSNSATSFAKLTYGTDTGWTQLNTYSDESHTLSKTTFDIHTSSNIADPKYIYIDNSVVYQYYAIKIADNWGHASLMGVRRLELQTEDGYTPPTGNYGGVSIGQMLMVGV